VGFFSSKCEGCTKPILSTYANVLPVAAWMAEATVVSPEGTVTAGFYDGYGNVTAEHPDTLPLGAQGNRALLGATVWHAACWEVAGRPADFRGESADAEDQGFFFSPDKYTAPDPRGQN
jgi:hypothetical protein